MCDNTQPQKVMKNCWSLFCGWDVLGVCRVHLHFNPCCFKRLIGLLRLLGSGPGWAELGAKEGTAVLKSAQPERAGEVMG